MRVAILTISDAGARGERADTSGDAIQQWAADRGCTLAERSLVPDDTTLIVSTLAAWCDADAADLVLTTGGTGLAPRDVTPEATRAVLHREIPGLGELMRAKGREATPLAVLSRAVAGTRGKVLIVNLPGSPKGAVESLDAIVELVPHVLELLRGRTEHA